MKKTLISTLAAAALGLGLTAFGVFPTAETSDAAAPIADVTPIDVDNTPAPAAEITPAAAPAVAAEPAQRVAPPAPVVDNLSPITSPDFGDWCAAGLDAASLNTFFNDAHGQFFGADYQRAYRLPDDRVLWMFQDAFLTINGSQVLAHNVGMIQSGKCFTLLTSSSGNHSWLMNDATNGNSVWYWAMGGKVTADGTTLQIAVTEMTERGAKYLSNVEPTGTYIVNINLADMSTTSTLAAWSSAALYGWTITSDSDFTYLYGWCYKQFGWGFLGADACETDVHLARQARSADLGSPLEYWAGNGWVTDPSAAVSVFGKVDTGNDINPVEVTFDGSKFVAISKPGDWFGDTVAIYTSTSATGPWTKVASVTATTKCDPASCDTYWASLMPWRDAAGNLVWALSHNKWEGGITPVYRPTMQATSITG